jgi:cytochrome c peroxidase
MTRLRVSFMLRSSSVQASCLAVFGWLIFCGAAARSQEYVLPHGLSALKTPADNPYSNEKAELGKQLYFDKRLSRDNSVSCATCHDPQKGWSNGEAVATGIRGQKGGRSAPTIINAAFAPLQFWDGRAVGLEGQALGPIQNPIEMDLTLDEMVKKLNAIEGYRKQFQKVFKTEVTAENVGRAIACFERTVLSGNAPYDRFKTGDKTALSESAQRGMKLFFGKANCSACHSGAAFSDGAFHNIGMGTQPGRIDLGRFEHSKLDGDKSSFKTPGLREIKHTAPYMHDGSHKSLREVVEYYNKGGEANPQLDEEIFPLKLTEQEVTDLVRFLEEGLCGDYPQVTPPKLP